MARAPLPRFPTCHLFLLFLSNLAVCPFDIQMGVGSCHCSRLVGHARLYSCRFKINILSLSPPPLSHPKLWQVWALKASRRGGGVGVRWERKRSNATNLPWSLLQPQCILPPKDGDAEAGSLWRVATVCLWAVLCFLSCIVLPFPGAREPPDQCSIGGLQSPVVVFGADSNLSQGVHTRQNGWAFESGVPKLLLVCSFSFSSRPTPLPSPPPRTCLAALRCSMRSGALQIVSSLNFGVSFMGKKLYHFSLWPIFCWSLHNPLCPPCLRFISTVTFSNVNLGISFCIPQWQWCSEHFWSR